MRENCKRMGTNPFELESAMSDKELIVQNLIPEDTINGAHISARRGMTVNRHALDTINMEEAFMQTCLDGGLTHGTITGRLPSIPPSHKTQITRPTTMTDMEAPLRADLWADELHRQMKNSGIAPVVVDSIPCDIDELLTDAQREAQEHVAEHKAIWTQELDLNQIEARAIAHSTGKTLVSHSIGKTLVSGMIQQVETDKQKRKRLKQERAQAIEDGEVYITLTRRDRSKNRAQKKARKKNRK